MLKGTRSSTNRVGWVVYGGQGSVVRIQSSRPILTPRAFVRGNCSVVASAEMLRAIGVLVIAVVLMPTSAGAVCVTWPLSEAATSATLIFSGTFTNTRTMPEYRSYSIVTFTVYRIWKGEPGQQVTLASQNSDEGITLVQ